MAVYAQTLPIWEHQEAAFTSDLAFWHAIAAKVLRSRADQEDAVQAAFAKCLRRSTAFNDEIHARKCLSLAVYHSAVDISRRNTRRGRRFCSLEAHLLEQAARR